MDAHLGFVVQQNRQCDDCTELLFIWHGFSAQNRNAVFGCPVMAGFFSLGHWEAALVLTPLSFPPAHVHISLPMTMQQIKWINLPLKTQDGILR